MFTKKMKNTFKWILISGTATLILGLLSYYSYKLTIAQMNTPEIKQQFLHHSKINLHYHELSDRQKEILISVQDPNFWHHKGVEFSTPGSGWTTITQSIAKWFYFSPFKPGFRKIEQTLLARFILNAQLSKEEQMLIFINHLWFDRKVYGFRNAAHHFFNKDIKALNEDEFISLMAMPVSPKTYNIFNNKDNNKRRSEKIKNMLSGEYKIQGVLDIYYDK